MQNLDDESFIRWYIKMQTLRVFTIIPICLYMSFIALCAMIVFGSFGLYGTWVGWSALAITTFLIFFLTMISTVIMKSSTNYSTDACKIESMKRSLRSPLVSPVSAPVNHVEYPAAFIRKAEHAHEEKVLDSDKDSFKDSNVV